MPHGIRKLKYLSLVLSRTRRLGYYQSGDAIIEEINKEAKRDVVGVPNETQWKRSFRNLDTMNKIRRVTCTDAGIKDQRNSSCDSACSICQEVTKIRTIMCEHNYL